MKASNVNPSTEPYIFVEAITPFNDKAPNMETFLPLFCGFSPLALSPFKLRAYNLTRAKFTPDSSINITSC